MSTDRWVFVLSAYGISFAVLALLIVWIISSRRTAIRELTSLEASGIKRRSDH